MKDTEETLHSKSIFDLRFRLAVLDKIIREAQKAGDERWKEPARQQRVINAVLVEKIREARRRRGEPEPEPITIGMQPLHLENKTPSRGER